MQLVCASTVLRLHIVLKPDVMPGMQSLEALLEALQREGYDLGPHASKVDGEAIVRALQSQEDQRAILEGARGIESR